MPSILGHKKVLLLIAIACAIPSVGIVLLLVTVGATYNFDDVWRWKVVLPILFLVGLVCASVGIRKGDQSGRLPFSVAIAIHGVSMAILMYWYL